MNRKSVHVILIEDDPGDAEMIIRALKKTRANIELAHVEDGAAAIDLIFGQGEYSAEGIRIPEIVILDLNMPKMNGPHVLKRIRADERTRRIPVVVLTSSREDSDLSKCYDLGVNSYIVKPVEYKEFTKTISNIGHYWLELNQTAN